MMDILTEAEAKTRRCPYSFGPPLSQDGRTLATSSTSYGSSEAITTSPTHCIAGECMAWRLAHKDAADGTERGYCGAFGLPRFT